MTKTCRFLAVFCLFTLVSCSDSDDDFPVVALKSLADTKLADFNFDSNVEYMEKRTFFLGEEVDNFQVSDEFDPEIKAALSDVQLSTLQQATTSSGIGSGCMPASCTFYFVTFEQDVVTVIDNVLDLETLLGEIDRPAELHLVLLNSKYYAQFYEEIENGFRVIASWNDCNGATGEDLLEIDSEGNVVLIKEIAKRQVNFLC